MLLIRRNLKKRAKTVDSKFGFMYNNICCLTAHRFAVVAELAYAHV